MAMQGRQQTLPQDKAHTAVPPNLGRHPHSGKAKPLPVGKAMLQPQHRTMQGLLNRLVGGIPASSRVVPTGSTCSYLLTVPMLTTSCHASKVYLAHVEMKLSGAIKQLCIKLFCMSYPPGF